VINQINLSSQPFRNRTLPWILSAVLLAVSLFGAFFVLIEYRKVSGQTKAVKEETDKIQPQIAALKGESENIKQSLTPEQYALLRSAHSIVDRKRFSWSRLLSDLENVLPRDVGVSNISVRDVYVDNRKTVAELDFAVLSRDYQSIVNNSGIFFAVELRGQDLQRDKGNVTEYTMQLRYSPRAGIPVAPENETATTAQNQTLREVSGR
jgi:hypothetical protein